MPGLKRQNKISKWTRPAANVKIKTVFWSSSNGTNASTVFISRESRDKNV